MLSYQTIDFCHDISLFLKDLSAFSFTEEVKNYLLSEQYSKQYNLALRYWLKITLNRY